MIQKGGTMENSNFKMLTSNEIMEINGGIALTTAMLMEDYLLLRQVR